MSSFFSVFHCGGGCCNQEIEQLLTYLDTADSDIDFVLTPKIANVLLITGTINCKNTDIVLNVFEQMPQQKNNKRGFVMVAGVCALSGGVYNESYIQFVDIEKILPVDIFIGGCPPSPSDFLKAFRRLKKIAEKTF